MVLRQNVSDDVYGTFCVESGETNKRPAHQSSERLEGDQLAHRVCREHGAAIRSDSQCVVKFPRAVLVHVGRVGQVLVGGGNVDVFPAEHGLSDVQRCLQLDRKEGA